MSDEPTLPARRAELATTLPARQLRARLVLWSSAVFGGGCGLAGSAILLPTLLAAIPSGWLQGSFGMYGGVALGGMIPLALFLPLGLLAGTLLRLVSRSSQVPADGPDRLVEVTTAAFGAAVLGGILLQSGGSLWMLRGLGPFLAAAAGATGLLGLVATPLPAPPERPPARVGLLQGLLVGGVLGSLGFMLVSLASLAESYGAGGVIDLLARLGALGPGSYVLLSLAYWLPISLLYVPLGLLLRSSRRAAPRRAVLVGAIGPVALALGLFGLGELFGSSGAFLPPAAHLSFGELAVMIMAWLSVVGSQALCLGLALGPARPVAPRLAPGTAAESGQPAGSLARK